MDVAVPYDAVEPKTRLSPVLEPAERAAFSRAVLGDVLDAIRGADPELGEDAERDRALEPTVYATGPVDVDAPAVVDERPLDPLVEDLLADPPVAVVMADLALATPAAIERLFIPSADVVLAPGLGGGTNALVVRTPDFSVDFHGTSIRDHRVIADELDATVAEVDSARLAVDVDEPDDLVEVLLHGSGRAPGWLRDRGIELASTGGRTAVRRTD